MVGSCVRAATQNGFVDMNRSERRVFRLTHWCDPRPRVGIVAFAFQRQSFVRFAWNMKDECNKKIDGGSQHPEKISEPHHTRGRVFHRPVNLSFQNRPDCPFVKKLNWLVQLATSGLEPNCPVP